MSRPTYEELFQQNRDLTRQVQELERDLLQFKVMQTALKTTQVMVNVMDLDSRILSVNESHLAVLGYTSEEMVGQKGFDFIHPEDRKRLLGLLASYVPKFAYVVAKSLLTGKTVPITETVEYRLRHKDGSWHWLESIGTIMDRRIYCFSRDVTRRKEAEQERKQIHEQLVNAAKLASIGTLSAGLAHELNNPLTAVMGNAEMIESDPDDEKSVLKRARRIRSSAKRMKELVEYIRRFSRQSRFDDRQHLNINRILRSSLVVLEPLLKERQIQLSLELDEDLPEVAGEPDQLVNVFHHLIINSMDAFDRFTDKVEPRIRLFSARRDRGGVLIVMEDNASGMSDEVARQAFDPFFTTKEMGKGAGLGLFVSQGIVKDHDGTISLSTAPGRGTRFELRFPEAR
jgi:PAS domain S-box-containing protein